MKLRASAPVSWPTQDARDVWWRDVLRSVDLGEQPVRLVAGEHLSPGATYEVNLPDAQRTAIRGVVGPDEVLRAEFVPHSESTRPDMVLSTVRALRDLSTSGRLEHLRWDGRLRPGDHASPVTAALRVPWLTARVELQVEEVAGGERLHAYADLHGRGAWWPVLTAIFAASGKSLHETFELVVSNLAAQFTNVAQGGGFVPPRPFPAPETRTNGPTRLTDEFFEFEWLRSPLATYRFFKAP